MKLKRENILGVEISAINMEQALEYCSEVIIRDEKSYICVAPAHSIMDCVADGDLRRIFNRSGLTTPDGMSVVWILKLRGNKFVSRVYGPDLLLSLCKRSESIGWSHYFYGSTKEVLESLTTNLEELYKELKIVGTYSPEFTENQIVESDDMVAKINQVKPDIIWVSLGSPKQDYWMHNHRERLDAPLIIGVGAAFDFVAGSKRQAPIWIQKIGLEWLFRFLNEPKRLWKRYRQYPRFVLMVLLEMIGIRVVRV